MTFSIVGRSAEGDSWGVAVASKFLAVGAAVPAAVSGVGAVATQAGANVAWKIQALAMLDDGATAEVALARLVEDDDKPETRQVGLVDTTGGSATHTGRECLDWAGGVAAPDVAIQGNILAGPQVVEAMKTAWDTGTDKALAHRLLDALAAGDAAGGDRRGRQSAALLVVREGAGYDGGDDIAADLRVDDHPDPVGELARLLVLNDFFLSAPPEAERVPLDDALRASLEQQARQLGHPDFDAWVGTENYEMRVGPDWVDRRVLEIIQTSTLS